MGSSCSFLNALSKAQGYVSILFKSCRVDERVQSDKPKDVAQTGKITTFSPPGTTDGCTSIVLIHVPRTSLVECWQQWEAIESLYLSPRNFFHSQKSFGRGSV